MSFARAYGVGRAGERRLAMHYGGTLAAPRCAYDMTIPEQSLPAWLRPALSPNRHPGAGITVEIKTDGHDPLDTPNLYLERRTIRPDGGVLEGGLWRAAADGVDAMAYWFPSGGLVLWMWELPTLCGRLDALAPGSRWRRVAVRNGNGYRAEGRLVPRVELADIAAPSWCEETILVAASGGS